MKKGIFAKLSGHSFRAMLFRTVCILFVLLVISAWSVSGVYAKYVDSMSGNDSAGLARMGIVKFELLEHKVKDISDDFDALAGSEYGSLYELDLANKASTSGNTYSKVIPGIDIPKDPFIELVLENTEVSYELYVIVEKKNLSDVQDNGFLQYITWEETADWVVAAEEKATKDGTTITYKYRDVFYAGTAVSFLTDETQGPIQILKGNKIKVSEHFNSEENVRFSVTFTAYLQQVINTSQGDDANGD